MVCKPCFVAKRLFPSIMKAICFGMGPACNTRAIHLLMASQIPAATVRILPKHVILIAVCNRLNSYRQSRSEIVLVGRLHASASRFPGLHDRRMECQAEQACTTPCCVLLLMRGPLEVIALVWGSVKLPWSFDIAMALKYCTRTLCFTST